jgi:hypothetical protein
MEQGGAQQGYYQNGVAPEGYMATPEARSGGTPRGAIAAAGRNLPDAVRRADAFVVRMVREQPLAALGVALAVGYVLGRSLRRWF